MKSNNQIQEMEAMSISKLSQEAINRNNKLIAKYLDLNDGNIDFNYHTNFKELKQLFRLIKLSNSEGDTKTTVKTEGSRMTFRVTCSKIGFNEIVVETRSFNYSSEFDWMYFSFIGYALWIDEFDFDNRLINDLAINKNIFNYNEK